MPSSTQAALDAYLDRLCDTAENFYLCSAEPATFTAASVTNKLGTKASPSIAAASDRSPDGRKRTIAAITDGSVDANGTAAGWGLTDDSASELLSSGLLGSSQAVTSGNTFTTTATDLGIADPT